MKESIKESLIAYVKTKYKAQPEHLWLRFPNYMIFRHADNEKWFGIIMDVPGKRLGLESEDFVDILNVKLGDPLLVDLLLQQPGYLRGYHISRGSWVSILLDGSVPLEDVCHWLDESYLVTASREKKQKLRPPKKWLVPANPKYYDIEHAFDRAAEIDWKQGKGIKKGDTVFLYVAAPVSAILYKCTVTKTDIPCGYDDGKLRVDTLMRIRLQKRYPREKFPFAVLEREYGIYAVRGPRGIPERLSNALK
jgi:predicted DNA-binding protein (MmcQ/YjbR family)